MPIISDRTWILLNLFWPQRRRPDPHHAIPATDRDLHGKTIVLTGGTDGIGRAAAGMLCQMGAHVVILGRNAETGAAVVQDLAQGPGSAAFELCDLSSMDSVADCAARVRQHYARIDVLINCAGVNHVPRPLTPDGFDMTWAVNYLAPYLLTHLLLDRLAAAARVVNVTTNTAFLEHYDIDKITAQEGLRTDEPYTESKLSLDMMTIDLAQELADQGVSVNCLFPGNIKSALLRDAGALGKLVMMMFSPTEVGADRVVRLAVSSEFDGVSGAFVAEDRIRPHHVDAQDAVRRQALKTFTQAILSKWLDRPAAPEGAT